ncbi:MAG: Reverse transcriptase (RNA-dependent DNA polymerase) [Clostridia bacterium]|nr:Reverse transcriptase (RNA-dependent DNA polymerase) [Clostridia bacterium]
MNIFYDANEIYEAGTKAIKSAPFKYQTQLFEINHLLETAQIQKDLKEWKYKPTKGRRFTIKERGKTRHIITNNMVDKTLNHLLCDNILSPVINSYLIYDNGASQKGKGVAFHRRRLEVHLHRYYRKYKSNEGYVLLIDFSGYYASIPHELCLKEIELFLRKCNNEEKTITLWILKNLFDVFDIDNKTKRGVDIGSQPSQNIGVLYASKIDNYIKIVKGVKYYGRYTDDCYIIHNDKAFLKQLLKEIKVISEKLGLVINDRKTRIAKLSQPFKILQLSYQLTETGRIIRKISSKAITRERRKIKAYKRLLDTNRIKYSEIENVFKSWMAGNYKNMSMQQISNMSQLYYDLFKRRVTWKNHGKLRYLMEHNLQTLD